MRASAVDVLFVVVLAYSGLCRDLNEAIATLSSST